MYNDKNSPISTEEIKTGMKLDAEKKGLIKTELGIDIDSNTLSPMSDYVFKRIFTADEKNSKRALIDLLNSILMLESSEEIEDIRVINPQIPVDTNKWKKSIFDIRAEFKNGEQVIIEMQINKEYDFEKRSQFIISKTYVSQPISGQDYDALKKCYLICFMNFIMFDKDNNYVRDYRYRDKDGNDLSDDETIIFIELKKLDDILCKPISEMTGLDMWSLFIRYAQDESKKELIGRIIEKKEGIRMGAGILNEISRNEQERAQYESELIFELDYRNTINKARKEGEARGVMKKAIESAKAALGLGLSLEQASKISGLTPEKIKQYIQTDA